MESLRKWFYRPKRDDRSLLAQFFYADDALNMVAAELDSFDGRKDPDRCTTLVNQLRHAQDRVLNITSQIMDQVLGDERVARGFRVKFPEDVLQDNLAGQLWFGAECLAAGSSIMNREGESAAMRPLAKALTRSLETVRSLLREQCLRPRSLALQQHDDMLQESLKIFDRLFAKFELCYVSAMVNVKTPHEFEAQQLICVLFSESLSRALKQGLLTQEQVDSYDPALMFAVPRLAIVSGLLIYSSGPLSIDKVPDDMSDMFRPFRALLHKIRALLWTLDRRELHALESLLCTNEDISSLANLQLPSDKINDSCSYPDIGEFVTRFYNDHAHCRDMYVSTQSSNCQGISDSDYLPDNIEVMTPILDGLRRLSEDTTSQTPETQDLKEDSSHSTNKTSYSSDTSTETFQAQEVLETKRRVSRSDSNDLASLRNLSTNGLMMFDPVVINAVSNASTSAESNWMLPDPNIVTSLNEQVTEITDRLSSIAANDNEINLDHQVHSFSTNDVPALISTDCDDVAYGFSNDLNCMPSTSHGYLIPNAISQEPVILASLSHNNSAVFNTEDENIDLNGAILNSDLFIPDNNIESEIVNTNITIANANLSSLLLTNEEFRHNFLEENAETPDSDNASFHSAKLNADSSENEPVKFILGYDSDTNEMSPGDSGVSTENTSLDRSPDSDQNKVVKDNHYMEQNRVLRSPVGEKDEAKNTLENSFSENINDVHEDNGDVTVDLNYIDESDPQKNEACSSTQCTDNVNIDDNEKCDNNCKENNDNEEFEEARRLEEDWGDNQELDVVISEILRRRKNSKYENSNSTARMPRSEPTTSLPHTSSSGRSKVKKSTKSKKKKSKMWSPGMVILENRAAANQNRPLRLHLDHFVDESGGHDASDCADDEEIALALQAQELAARQQARSKFKSSEDLIHRLFVCIAGVADQLQTNFAADLRNILKAVFLMNQSPDKPETPPPEPEPERETVKTENLEYAATEDQVIQNGGSFDSVYSAEEVYPDSSSDSSDARSRPVRSNTNTMTRDNPTTTSSERRKSADNVNMQSSVSTSDLSELRNESTTETLERAPEWIPDIAAPDCMRCCAHFTAFRRRHHCRNCGKVFCASCSSNSIPLPRFGQMKPVRVCEECFRSLANRCRRVSQQQ